MAEGSIWVKSLPDFHIHRRVAMKVEAERKDDREKPVEKEPKHDAFPEKGSLADYADFLDGTGRYADS